MKPLASASLAIAALATCVSGYQRWPTVSDDDARNVLTVAARMIGNSRGVVAFGCVHAAIEPGHGDLLMKTDEWQSLQNSDVRFRPLRAPSLARIPDAAIMALGKRVTTAQCPDTLGFEPPQFVLLDTETGMTEIAIVIFHDRTTAHFIQLNWSGGRWVPDKAGFGPTWLN